MINIINTSAIIKSNYSFTINEKNIITMHNNHVLFTCYKKLLDYIHNNTDIDKVITVGSTIGLISYIAAEKYNNIIVYEPNINYINVINEIIIRYHIADKIVVNEYDINNILKLDLSNTCLFLVDIVLDNDSLIKYISLNPKYCIIEYNTQLPIDSFLKILQLYFLKVILVLDNIKKIYLCTNIILPL
jgi:hypothetical protein